MSPLGHLAMRAATPDLAEIVSWCGAGSFGAGPTRVFRGAVVKSGAASGRLDSVDMAESKSTPVGGELLGLTPGLVIQELGWDEDVDADLRDDIMDSIDAEMVDDPLEAVDVVVLWWRDEDGDVADGLVDATTDLTDAGCIWLLTPKVGRPGFIPAASLAEGVTVAGLTLTNTASVAPDWQATKVLRPKGSRR